VPRPIFLRLDGHGFRIRRKIRSKPANATLRRWIFLRLGGHGCRIRRKIVVTQEDHHWRVGAQEG
jgi:hypothetical protein